MVQRSQTTGGLILGEQPGGYSTGDPAAIYAQGGEAATRDAPAGAWAIAKAEQHFLNARTLLADQAHGRFDPDATAVGQVLNGLDTLLDWLKSFPAGDDRAGGT